MPQRRPRTERQRRRIRGNLVAPQIDALLADPGARQRLIAKLQLIAATPGFEDLEGFSASSLSWLDPKYQTACPDKLAVALCWALGEVLGRGPIDLYYLLGMRPDSTPPPDVTWPFATEPSVKPENEQESQK